MNTINSVIDYRTNNGTVVAQVLVGNEKQNLHWLTAHEGLSNNDIVTPVCGSKVYTDVIACMSLHLDMTLDEINNLVC